MRGECEGVRGECEGSARGCEGGVTVAAWHTEAGLAKYTYSKTQGACSGFSMLLEMQLCMRGGVPSRGSSSAAPGGTSPTSSKPRPERVPAWGGVGCGLPGVGWGYKGLPGVGYYQ